MAEGNQREAEKCFGGQTPLLQSRAPRQASLLWIWILYSAFIFIRTVTGRSKPSSSDPTLYLPQALQAARAGKMRRMIRKPFDQKLRS